VETQQYTHYERNHELHIYWSPPHKQPVGEKGFLVIPQGEDKGGGGRRGISQSGKREKMEEHSLFFIMQHDMGV